MCRISKVYALKCLIPFETSKKESDNVSKGSLFSKWTSKDSPLLSLEQLVLTKEVPF